MLGFIFEVGGRYGIAGLKVGRGLAPFTHFINYLDDGKDW